MGWTRRERQRHRSSRRSGVGFPRDHATCCAASCGSGRRRRGRANDSWTSPPAQRRRRRGRSWRTRSWSATESADGPPGDSSTRSSRIGSTGRFPDDRRHAQNVERADTRAPSVGVVDETSSLSSLRVPLRLASARRGPSRRDRGARLPRRGARGPAGAAGDGHEAAGNVPAFESSPGAGCSTTSSIQGTIEQSPSRSTPVE